MRLVVKGNKLAIHPKHSLQNFTGTTLSRYWHIHRNILRPYVSSVSKRFLETFIYKTAGFQPYGADALVGVSVFVRRRISHFLRQWHNAGLVSAENLGLGTITVQYWSDVGITLG
ncbi:hypothetical protein TSAR_001697 [Trichomalopsis sarcophagae]|uniref:Uncharacterized protein n=1 Tax=Trichomalopsis sarcophagae TaxID=543379 RepID=A0A232EMV4_9HYME|nr:hypothetical protein TSAR_001697 [Trichomalopsis sarcophagae]